MLDLARFRTLMQQHGTMSCEEHPKRMHIRPPISVYFYTWFVRGFHASIGTRRL